MANEIEIRYYTFLIDINVQTNFGSFVASGWEDKPVTNWSTKSTQAWRRAGSLRPPFWNIQNSRISNFNWQWRQSIIDCIVRVCATRCKHVIETHKNVLACRRSFKNWRSILWWTRRHTFQKKSLWALMGRAIHRWKAIILLNPNMVEFKCVTRVNSAQFTFKES